MHDRTKTYRSLDSKEDEIPVRRAMTSILTGFALLLQPLLLPLASSVQSNDPIGAGGFIGPPQPPGPNSNQTTQTSRNFLVRVCVPPDPRNLLEEVSAEQYIYPLAALRLGGLYETGQGVPQNVRNSGPFCNSLGTGAP